MQRVIAAGLLALLMATTTIAQYPGCAADGGTGGGAYTWGHGHAAHGYEHLGKIISNPNYGCKHSGCGGFCFRLFPGFHQEGPLFNYGPYVGYYPFQPYGPWTSDLQYTGPRGPVGDYGHGHAWGSHLHALSDKLHSLGHRTCKGGDCSSCGGYAKTTFHNVGHRVNPFGHGHHKKAGCTDCAGSIGTGAIEGQTVISTPEHVANSVDNSSDPVVQAGYPRRER